MSDYFFKERTLREALGAVFKEDVFTKKDIVSGVKKAARGVGKLAKLGVKGWKAASLALGAGYDMAAGATARVVMSGYYALKGKINEAREQQEVEFKDSQTQKAQLGVLENRALVKSLLDELREARPDIGYEQHVRMSKDAKGGVDLVTFVTTLPDKDRPGEFARISVSSKGVLMQGFGKADITGELADLGRELDSHNPTKPKAPANPVAYKAGQDALQGKEQQANKYLTDLGLRHPSFSFRQHTFFDESHGVDRIVITTNVPAQTEMRDFISLVITPGNTSLKGMGPRGEFSSVALSHALHFITGAVQDKMPVRFGNKPSGEAAQKLPVLNEVAAVKPP